MEQGLRNNPVLVNRRAKQISYWLRGPSTLQKQHTSFSEALAAPPQLVQVILTSGVISILQPETVCACAMLILPRVQNRDDSDHLMCRGRGEGFVP